MKVGTDGVLLGAWVSLEKIPDTVLDIGAGTGLIALQIAQRSQAESIDAIEIDPDSYEQCVENFENSPWNDRLFCYHSSLQNFAEEIDDTYDLIISNPPFFSEDIRPENPSRNRARFTDSLPFIELLQCASKLLAAEGSFAVILPRKEEEDFIKSASQFALYPERICRVRGNKNSPEKRSLLEFSFNPSGLKTESLIIEEERHQYTEAYRRLVSSFYLNL